MKRKELRAMLAMLAVVFAFVVVASGSWRWMPCAEQESANKGANHMALFKYGDFSACTLTNTAYYFTNTIPGGWAVEFVALAMDQAFNTGNTNYTQSCALEVGDGSDGDYFLSSTELARDGTEVYVKYGRPHDYTIALTLQKHLVTDGTNTFQAVTNATATATVSELGRKLYPTGGNLVFKFTPNVNESLSANTAGTVRLYFRLLSPADRFPVAAISPD